ncbi:MAG: AAA family ATPase [Peptococcaceae bacterium]|jgi:predicted ATPase|nr:AAA family ATPase [Peptococcaceae bacterium]
MTINRVEIKDFLVFRGEFSADFCPGVNVLIGGNGTGKTTLMKAMYGICENSNPILGNADAPLSDRAMWKYRAGSSTLAHYFTANLDNSHWERFYDICNTLNRCQIIYNGIRFGWRDMTADIELDMRQRGELGEDGHIQTLPSYEIRMESTQNSLPAFDEKTSEPFIKSVYIPTTDMLSHSRNLLEFKYKYPDLPFDKTLIDIIANAKQPSVIGYPNGEVNVFTAIENIVGGEVILENDVFYVKKKDNAGQMTEMSLVASGHRKFGLMYKLLRNGLLKTGSALFWDEPENSLNPELVPILVDILLELSQNGVQIFIATHSDFLCKWLELKTNDSNGTGIKFFSLYKESIGISTETSKKYRSLTRNSIIEQSVELYNEHLRRAPEQDED